MYLVKVKGDKEYRVTEEEGEKIRATWKDEKKRQQVLTLEGDDFIFRDIVGIKKTNTDIHYLATCDKCEDGWVELSKTGKWTVAPCDFSMTPCSCTRGMANRQVIEKQ